MKRPISTKNGQLPYVNTVNEVVGFFSWMFLFLLNPQPVFAAPVDDFVTTWKTDHPGTSNSTSITVPMVGGPFDLDWNNDGVFDEFGLYGTVTHEYGSAGIYVIRIRGSYGSIRFIGSGDEENLFLWINGGRKHVFLWRVLSMVL